MNIIVDAFGGDNAPLEIIKGCVEAVAEYNINVTLIGDETKIKNVFSENSLSMNNIDICHCTQKITMEDSASRLVSSYSSQSFEMISSYCF
jgi:phosphate acyltransferase